MAKAGSEKSFPFDAEEVGGEWDRTYLADEFAEYFRAFITDGIFTRESDNLQVFANGDMTATLRPGRLIGQGYRYTNEKDIAIEFDPADGIMDRIDRVCITWMKEERDFYHTIQKGAPSYDPVPPECRRTAEYRDYVLADVRIRAGAISIAQSDITDQRLNEALCGVATPFAPVDTETFFNQFTAWYSEITTAGNAEVAAMIEGYRAWLQQLTESGKAETQALLEEMRDLLDGSAAGKLQNQIDDLVKREFLRAYALANETTVTTTDPDTGKTIKVVKTSGEATATTLIADDEAAGRKTVTSTVVPAEGSYQYVQTTVIENTATGKEITKAYTQELKA